MDAVIEVKDLWWRYALSDRWALKGVNLTVERGEFLGIVGPSESGKTTLCLCLTGLIPQLVGGEMKGEVNIYGLNTRNTPLHRLLRKVGIVFQDPDTQLVTMTLEDEIAFPMENFGYPVEEMRRRISEAVKITRLSGLEKKYPHELSGGQKQRLAIATFLALKPEVLILDEPTSNLDPVGREEVFSTLMRLKESEDMTLIVVEHDTENLAQFADRIILLNDGQIVRHGPPHELFKQVEFLRSIGVLPPQVTEICDALNVKAGSRNLPITIDEALDYLRDLKLKVNPIDSSLSKGKEADKGRPIVDVRNVDYVYPDGTKALKNINLQIKRGEYVALIGQNGSGKTTLAKLLVGLLKPTKGDVIVFGMNTKKVRIIDLAKKVNYVYQNPDHQLFCKTVYDECAYGLRNLGLGEEEVKRRVSRVLEVVGLKGMEDKETFLLSKGQRTRLAVATVLAMEPELIIVDEPTTGQDMKQSKNMMNLLDELNRNGKTIIVITHNIRLVAEHTRRVIVMLGGEVIADGRTEDILGREETLRKAFLTPPQVTRLARALFPERTDFIPLTVDAFLRSIESTIGEVKSIG